MEKLFDMIDEVHKLLAASSLKGEEYQKISHKLIMLKWELRNVTKNEVKITFNDTFSCTNDETDIA